MRDLHATIQWDGTILLILIPVPAVTQPLNEPHNNSIFALGDF